MILMANIRMSASALVTYLRLITPSQTFTMYMDHDVRVCPVLHLLAIAFEDQVLDKLESASELLHRQVPEGTRSLELPLRESILDEAVFRKRPSRSPLCGLVAESVDVLSRRLVDLGQVAGYRHNLTTYCMRRAVGNKIDGKTTSSSTGID